MTEMMIDLKRGRYVSAGQLEQEYIDAVSRLRVYERNVLKKHNFDDVKSQSDLQGWIEGITKATGGSLAKKAYRIDKIRELIDANIRQRNEQIKIKDAPSFRTYKTRKESKKQGGVYVGFYKRTLNSGKTKKIPYAFNYGTKKRMKLKDAV